MSEAAEIWKKRVASWRASGQTAEAFSEGRGWSPKTLRWSSQLGRESAKTPPVIRVAQLMRSPAIERGSVVVEILDARVRITVEPGAPAETVSAVLSSLVNGEAP
jgi:hypothetical protein